ncbi:MAG: RHS repeat domain-containing protein [Pseudomonadota bacterium]
MTHSYDLVLLDLETDTVRVSTEDGKRIYFAKNSDGTYTTMAGYAAHGLTRNADGSYAYRLPLGKQYHFASSGKLTSIENKNGNILTLTRDAEGRLGSVADGAGRTLSFSYQAGDNKIRTVTDPAGRTVTYEYDSNDNLVAVTNPDGTLSCGRWTGD